MIIETQNPATGKVLHQFYTIPDELTVPIIEDCHFAFNSWRQRTLPERGYFLRQTANIMRRRKEDYARLISTEMGKPITAAEKEIEKCAWVCEYYADHGAELLAPRHVKTDYHTSYVCYEPLGVIFAIMPWNFPFWQVFRFAAPNLMAGNTIILRHADITSGCGSAIQLLLSDAQFPENVLRPVVVTHETAAFIIKHDLVRGVTLTGSPQAGRNVAATAGSALKKVVLELGGNDPYLILADANLQHAAETCVRSRLANSGQVCIAAKRLIVEESIYDEFQRLVLEQLQYYKMGDPLDRRTTLGPLARADLRETVHRQVLENIQQGAQLITGGNIPAQPGFFYPPTVLGNVQSHMSIMQEEVFGPVIALVPAKDVDHAITLANSSPYGLAAAVFTRDTDRGKYIAAQLQAGTCNINSSVASDPRLPFGGIKESGFGRELGQEGMHEFVNIKTICVP